MQVIRESRPDPVKQRIYRQAMLVAIIGNILLGVGKSIAAWLTGSASLYADAANSISDILYTILVTIGLYITMQPPDESHPQGHNRFEPLIGLVVTLAMGIAGYEAMRTAIRQLLAGGGVITPGMPTFVLLFSALIKGVMFLLIIRLGKNLNSPTLNTMARDNLSDVLTSSMAFIGTLGSFFLHPLFDPIGGILVSIWIFKSVFEAGKENLHYLTGGGADQETVEVIADKAKAVPGVRNVHHLITEYVGAQLVVDMHVKVDGEISMEEAHAINDRVIDALEDIPEVDRAYVHLEPYDWEERKRRKAEKENGTAEEKSI